MPFNALMRFVTADLYPAINEPMEISVAVAGAHGRAPPLRISIIYFFPAPCSRHD